jgi:hypothetical protein
MSSVTDVVDSMLGNVEVDMLCNVRKIGLLICFRTDQCGDS